jgi:hypothetical protein
MYKRFGPCWKSLSLYHVMIAVHCPRQRALRWQCAGCGREA